MPLGTPELEALAADGVASEAVRATRHGLPPGSPCPNCGTPLHGPWCHACGQKGEDFHRSIFHLVAEAFEGLTHFDGRFWRTVPRLILRPGALTRDYLDGRRVAQIPPFRLFLVVLLLVFFAGSLSMRGADTRLNLAQVNDPKVRAAMSAEDRAELDAARETIKRKLETPGAAARAAWWSERLAHAIDNPKAFFAAVEHWSHRFAILLLPVAALLLSGIFAFRRQTYVFDHLIFSMHSLSFLGLLLTTTFLLGMVLDGVGWLLAAAPVHLFVHMRGVYRTSVVGTLLRMAVLFLGTAVAVAFLMLGLFLVGLAEAH